MTTRYYEVTECEHGEPWPHSTGVTIDSEVKMCPGGVRRELTIDYRAAAIEWIGEEPPDNYPGEWEQMIQSVIEQTVQPIVQAALGDTDA